MPHVIARRRGRVRYQRVNRRHSAAPAEARHSAFTRAAVRRQSDATPVNVDTLVVLATDQADATTVYRRT